VKPTPTLIRIGVSACLLGAEVRFDGQHKRDRFLTDELAPFVEWVSVCPEVEVGMGIPREAVRLVRAPGNPERTLMLGNQTGQDWTARMEVVAQKRVEALAAEKLSGYVLKANSPSCGMERVKLYDGTQANATVVRTGVGLFAATLTRRFPTLPVEEEGRLHDPRLRENFIERVFAYERLQRLWADDFSVGDLVAFHTREKMALLAHSVDGYRVLGRLVAGAKGVPRASLKEQYEAKFMEVLKTLATPGRHANVLMHMLGHVSEHLNAEDRAELLSVIEDHRNGLVPLVVPVTLLRHHARRLRIDYLLGQSYLEPHPKELMLRNHV
jgi:uncharacterized protein YbgA (DUF1722 family)/uncharacterized protein YbbK (DUF523 family)